MFKKLSKDQKGFTIIEVLIVLAIAGLIMLIVFLAVPALQRNQRNNSRNSDGSRIAAAVSECLANRNGSTNNTNGCGNTANIQPGTLNTLATFTIGTTDGTSLTAATVRFNAQCNPEGDRTSTTAPPSARSFTVTFRLEPAIDRCISS